MAFIYLTNPKLSDNIAIMKKINLNQEHFYNEVAARKYLEKIRWKDGIPVCPHCGSKNNHYELKPKTSTSELRNGVWKCKDCRKQFSVTVGTIFERSHIQLNKWLLAVQLLCSSKKGISSKQIERMLGVSYKTAWFMMHRIRYALEQNPRLSKLIGIVEVDETYIGGKAKGTRGRGANNKIPVVSLVERKGKIRSFQTTRVTAKNLKEIIRENVDKSSMIITDEFKSYHGLKKEFKAHHIINHGEKEYVNGIISTNTVEGYFSLLKRGIIGAYHHISKQHLKRYLAEFDYRYNNRGNNDFVISEFVLNNIAGKRLMYRDSS